ncbi:prenyltransferase/squalene oxidase repeat-containing protein [Aeromicrobium chenweiae]|uniref:Uncharacterized protein n=1 Tax=Aeromicrobium chenweiae TaxID=2079793 RepID=A0A2S0WQR7_9ACTN|nr:prenyltransferase/squalene oxidase repeat-containing protein [Aeromicrobium chenweiae]AWB93657.1 hypothetical protein C3E78_16355 [Aeromicrobium chenweiae]TGN30494.1 hypothetical protein E4L97_17640 [Aeromicrobium chenweiae]
MKSTILRRLAVLAIAPALVACSSSDGKSAEKDTGPNAPQRAAVVWLSDQRGDDDLFTSHFTDVETGDVTPFVDYGLNLDLYAALTDLGDPKTAEKVYRATLAHADDYTDPPGGTRYAGALAKLAAMVQAHGDDANAVGSRHLIDELEALVVPTGAETGRAKDAPDGKFQSTSVLNQAWTVQALATAKSDDADAAVGFLLKQQCDDGSFREDMASKPCTDGPGSVDGTAFAIQSLQVAADQGSSGLDDDIDEAAEWLVRTQADDGSFSDAGGPNSNSTGQAAAALALTGHQRPARRAATWLAGLQVDGGPEKGAIAVNAADLSAAAGTTVAKADRDRYVRASVQAVLGLDALPAGPTTGSR